MRNRTENQIKLVMIRHGATKGNRERRYIGRTDTSLTDEGVKELLENKKGNCYPQADVLFVSPMKRCLETAGILYPGVRSVIIPEWKEIDFGAFEGKNYIELKEDDRYQAWIDSGGTLPFPEGESREAFISRCEAGFREMLEVLAAREGKEKACTAGLIVHGGTIQALLNRYSGGDYFDYQVPNGSGYLGTLLREDGKIKIELLRKISGGNN